MWQSSSPGSQMAPSRPHLFCARIFGVTGMLPQPLRAERREARRERKKGTNHERFGFYSLFFS